MNPLCTRIHTLNLLSLCVFLALAGAACQERPAGKTAESANRSIFADAQPNAALQTLVDSNELSSAVALPDMTAAERTRLADQVKRFYKAENYQLMWIDGDRASKRYAELLNVLNAA